MEAKVICDNPCAIDTSSSDEEEEIRCKPHCQKQFVPESIIPNQAEVKDGSPIAFGNHDYGNSSALQSYSGKSGAFTCDPVKKMKFYKVDSDDDVHEEATIAYDAKKHDFDSVDEFQNTGTQSMALNVNSIVGESEYTMKEDVPDFPVPDSEDHVEFTENRGLFLSKSGKWAACICHPTTKEDIWLGTYFTREEAADAYDRKKLEFECLAVVGSEKTSASLSNSTIQESIKDKADFVQKDDVSLGSCTTPVEAANAYESELLGFERSISTKELTGNQSSIMDISTPPGSDYKSMIKESSSFLQRNDDVLASGNHRETTAHRQLVLGQERVVRKHPRDETVDPSDSDCREEWEDTEYQGVKLRKSSMRSAEVCDHTNKGRKPIENHESEPQQLGAQEPVEVAISSKSYPGVRQRQGGKWSAEIGIPRTRGKFYLGTFNSQEEAADAFNKKKLEFQLIEDADKEKARKLESATSNDINCKDFSVRRYLGVTQSRGGKWVAEITKPKTEFQLIAEAREEKAQKPEFSTTNDINYKDFSVRKYPGVRQRKGGRWTAEIRKPRTKTKLYLGTFDTQEEAVDAFNKKKLEFQTIAEAPMEKAQKLEFLSVEASNMKKAKLEPGLCFRDEDELVKHDDSKRPKVGERESVEAAVIATDDINCEDLSVRSYCGIRQSQTSPGGKWMAEIREPGAANKKGSKLYLGSYNTQEEAADAFNKKKLEFQSIAEAPKEKAQKLEFTTADDINCEDSSVRRYLGIKRSRKGKWIAEIRKPRTKNKLYLGTFNTQEEAADAFNRKRLEFTTTDDINCEDSSVRRYCGIKRSRKGKWIAEIRKPRTKNKLYLGTFNTQEEAADAFYRKKLEFQSIAASSSKNLVLQSNLAASNTKKAKVESGIKDKPPLVGARESVEVAVTTTKDGINCKDFSKRKHPPGIRQRRPGGKWSARITIPLSGKAIRLGSYNTLEEAVDAYNKKKLEFQSMLSSSKKLVSQSTAATDTKKPEQPIGCSSASLPTIAFPKVQKSTVTFGNSHSSDGSSTVEDLSVMKMEQPIGCSLDQSGYSSASLPAFTFPEVEKSTVTFGNSHSSDGSCTVDLSVMELEQEDGFGCGIINCYGQLLGEYSKLDEELWLCKPGEDEAAASTIESSISECYSWELKPPVNFGIV